MGRLQGAGIGFRGIFCYRFKFVVMLDDLWGCMVEWLDLRGLLAFGYNRHGFESCGGQIFLRSTLLKVKS